MNHEGGKCKSDLRKVEELYQSYKKIMLYEAYKILKDQHLAEDAVHQSFIKVIDNLNKIDETNVERTRNFLVIICRNIAIDIYKTRINASPSSDLIEIMDADEADVLRNPDEPCELVISKETIKEIKIALESLDDLYKDIIILERFHGYSKKEIANLLNITYETVKKRSVRARNMLVKALEKEGII